MCARGIILALAGVVVTACGPRSSVVRTGANVYSPIAVEDVRVSATVIPPGAQQVGIVQTRLSGRIAIDEIVPAFMQKVAELGADLAKIDRIATRFEWHSSTQTYSYSCGQNMTCTGTRVVQTEVGTLQVVGRAFRTRNAPAPAAGPTE